MTKVAVASAGARLTESHARQPEIYEGFLMIRFIEDLLVVGTLLFGVAFTILFLFREEFTGERVAPQQPKDKETTT